MSNIDVEAFREKHIALETRNKRLEQLLKEANDKIDNLEKEAGMSIELYTERTILEKRGLL